MKFKAYIKDKFLSIILFIIMFFVLFLLMIAFKLPSSLIIAFFLIIFTCFFTMIFLDFYKRYKFYKVFINNIQMLDQKYLVLETINEPTFLDAKIMNDALYEINRSMIERMKTYEHSVNDFKEYVEMWIHEVKVPLSSLVLTTHNNQDKNGMKVFKQIKKIDDYVEQVLYYVRSENAEKDYLISEVKLSKVINTVALKNKDYLLESNVNLAVKDVNVTVYSDAKWLSFILNQIINNSIKYRDGKRESFIKIFTKVEKDNVTLLIKDNGIGISKADLPRVFEKSFTGKNGRGRAISTGMGLYIAKRLCDKLGHQILIDSKETSWTCVSIVFSINKFFDVA